MNVQKIKEKARQAYRDQQTQDNEGGCGEPIGFVTGYVQGYEDCKSETSLVDDLTNKILHLEQINKDLKSKNDILEYDIKKLQKEIVVAININSESLNIQNKLNNRIQVVTNLIKMVKDDPKYAESIKNELWKLLE